MQFQKFSQAKREGHLPFSWHNASTSPKNNSFWAMFLRGENIVNNEVVFFNEKDLRIRPGGDENYYLTKIDPKGENYERGVFIN